MSDHKIAIAHKDYDVRGGGEVLAEELARTFDCPLYVGHGDPDNQPDTVDIDIREIAPESRWHRLMERSGASRGIAHMMHWRDNAPGELNEYETVITSGNEPLWFMPQDHQTVVAYTHSPPRWMYDLYHDSEGFIGRTYQQVQRRLYEGPVKRPDVWVANSDLVARRIQLYWNIPQEQIRIVYPPVLTHEYDPDIRETGDYYLYLGRLAGHKRVNEVVEAFNTLDAELKIAGKGPAKDELEKLANKNISFEGFVSDEEKKRLYAGAKALIYPAQNEDFGMVPIESMAAGTPVIGVNEGFTRFQIQEGKTGLLFDRSASELATTIETFEAEGVVWSGTEIATWARKWFGQERFRTQMQNVVRETQAQTRVEPPWETETEPPQVHANVEDTT